MIPKNTEGLLVAGRCVSCDRVSFGALRLMVGCALTGQAAGTAAALSAKSGAPVRAVDLAELKSALVSMGTRFD